MTAARKRLLLGPQRPLRNLGNALRASGFPAGPLAVVSAGWQEAEGDIEDVHELVQQPLIDLQLYARAERLFAQDPGLHAAYRERQDRLMELQRLYELRLRHLSLAARQTLRATGDKKLLAGELQHAIAQLRALDAHHLGRVAELQRSFDERETPRNSAALAEHLDGIDAVLGRCETVLITGGNVIILLNRLQLFDMATRLAGKHVVAWSAGAMALSGLIVLFHDRTPLGRRDPEVLAPGLGLLPGYVFLPDARRRLRTADAVRMGLISRRYDPATCVTLDSGAQLLFDGDVLRHAELARRMGADGELERLLAP